MRREHADSHLAATGGAQEREHELGVRIALVARARNVVRLVLGGALCPVAAGLVLGLAAAAWAAPRVQALLFDMPAQDTGVLAGVAGLVLFTACAAALIPGLRAARVQPLEALRED